VESSLESELYPWTALALKSGKLGLASAGAASFCSSSIRSNHVEASVGAPELLLAMSRAQVCVYILTLL